MPDAGQVQPVSPEANPPNAAPTSRMEYSRAVMARSPPLVVAVPLSLVAANAGHRVYQRLSAQRFDRVVLWLLLFAGVGLLLAPR